MHLSIQKIWNSLRRPKIQTHRASDQAKRARPTLEMLEDRCVPATASGVLSGMAFLDSNSSGVFDAGDTRLPGVAVTLSGTTSQGTNVNAVALSKADGTFSFLNVLPGTYDLLSGGVSSLVGVSSVGAIVTPEGVTISNIAVTPGQNVGNQNLGLQGGISSDFVSLRQLLTSTTFDDFPFAPPGSGTALANYRANNTPTVKAGGIANATIGINSSKVIDLAGFFTDADVTNSLIAIDTTKGTINVQLFDTTAPQTVENFVNYIESNAYDNSIFNRLVSGFVLQGGGFKYNSTTHALDPITPTAPVPNEFGASNTIGTLAMAKQDGNPNSATNQFFFNLANNGGGSPALDTQNGGFTVFGKIVGASDQAVINSLAATPIKDQSAGNPNSPFKNIPLANYTGTLFPTDTIDANYIKINDIRILKRDEFLTYSVTSSNTNIATATVGTTNNEMLTVTTTGQTGTATITVTATDRYGATVQTTFTVTA